MRGKRKAQTCSYRNRAMAPNTERTREQKTRKEASPGGDGEFKLPTPKTSKWGEGNSRAWVRAKHATHSIHEGQLSFHQGWLLTSMLGVVPNRPEGIDILEENSVHLFPQNANKDYTWLNTLTTISTIIILLYTTSKSIKFTKRKLNFSVETWPLPVISSRRKSC